MLEKNYRKNDFIYSHRRFADPRDKLHLSIEEFYLYSILYTKRMMDGSIMVSVSLIEELLHIPFHKRPTRNRNTIRSVLINLIEKKVFIVHSFPELYQILNKNKEDKDKEIKKISYTKLFKLTVNIEYIKSEIDNKKWRGFVRIPFTELRKFNEMKDLYIYFSTFANETAEGKAKLSYEEWARILEVSYKTAVKYVDEATVDNEECSNDGVIYVQKGRIIDKVSARHETNVYSTSPFDSTEDPKIRKIKDDKSSGSNGNSNDDDDKTNPF